MFHQLKDVVEESGIWSGARSKSHAFCLSPNVYRITEKQRDELQRLGYAITDCIRGLATIAFVAYGPMSGSSGAIVTARRVFSTGVPRTYQYVAGYYFEHVIKDIPKLLKVDLMVDAEGNFKIAEIDGHNKHGVGYSTLAKRFREAIYPDAKALPGVVNLLCQYAAQRGIARSTLFYAQQEEFYRPEFEIAQQEFRAEGYDLLLLSEDEVIGTELKEGLFFDLPFLYHNITMYNVVLEAYKLGAVEFFIPPKPFLGAKGVLALLRNDTQDPELEALLRTFVKPKSLELVREYIPETHLVGMKATSLRRVKELIKHKRYVLKESISSGMKGTFFSDDPDFGSALSMASKANMNWILQEEVTNQPQTFSWFEDYRNGAAALHTANDWFMRVTVQYVNHQLADVVVTARRDKAVHGAKDCIQIGTVIV